MLEYFFRKSECLLNKRTVGKCIKHKVRGLIEFKSSFNAEDMLWLATL